MDLSDYTAAVIVPALVIAGLFIWASGWTLLQDTTPLLWRPVLAGVGCGFAVLVLILIGGVVWLLMQRSEVRGAP